MKIASSVAVSALALGLSLIASCSKSGGNKSKADRAEGVPVTVAKVEIISLDRALSVVGTLFAMNEATIGAQVEGQVEKTRVDFGDRVTAEQELALIDTTTYEARARQAAANVAKAKANALNAEQNLKRVQELGRDKVTSASELDKAIADAEQARADVKAAEAADAIAQLNLEHSRVKAPFDGAIAERVANKGDYLKVGEPLFRLVNDGELKLIVQAPERYAGQVRKDQRVTFTVDAWPGQTFEGRVYLISPAVNTATRAFNFAARVQNPDRKLKASTFARGELILEQNVPTPVVPLEAVVNFAGVTKAFVIENGVAHIREIKTGRVKDGRHEILSGLKVGEAVAVTGQTKLFEGAKVQLQTGSAGASAP